MSRERQEENPDRFPETRWSLVVAARGEDSPAAERAFSELCQIYWFPIYCYFRNAVRSTPEAEDLTQDFFEALIRRDSFSKANSDRGKLRSYLLSAARNFLISWRRGENTVKRGGGDRPLSIDAAAAEKQLAIEPRDGESPDLLFERAWARLLLDRIRSQVAQSYTTAGKATLFGELEPFIQGGVEPPYLDIAEQLDMSAGSLRVATFRLRQKFRALLETEIAETLADSEELEGELNYLLGLFTA